jgi:3-hydroxybutyryl-CoA dehydrogenase
MKNIGIVGAGTMGGGIAVVAALAGYDVDLADIDMRVLASTRTRIEFDLQRSVLRGKLSDQQAEASLSHITYHSAIDPLSRSEIVIEAIVEDLDLKQKLFATLEEICKPETILATNTSSLPVAAIGSGVKHRERVIGLHFFNPPLLMKLVEVVRAHESSDTTIEQATGFVKTLGKTPVVVRDTPGFIVNRIARPFYGEALKILGEGIASVEEIDRIVKLEGGFTMGPFELMDLIGVDVNLAVTKSMYDQSFGEPRYRPHIIQQQMVTTGRLGRKTGLGFYKYPV